MGKKLLIMQEHFPSFSHISIPCFFSVKDFQLFFNHQKLIFIENQQVSLVTSGNLTESLELFP
jgi:hypothetical protein